MLLKKQELDLSNFYVFKIYLTDSLDYLILRKTFIWLRRRSHFTAAVIKD